MHAKMNSTSQWIEAHMGALAVLLVVVAICGSVLVNLPRGIAQSVVGVTAPGKAAAVTSAEHERDLARLLELNTAYVPTYDPAAEDLARNERLAGRERELIKIGVSLVDAGF